MEEEPEWWHPLEPTPQQLEAHKSLNHTGCCDYGANQWVWRFLKAMSAQHQAWLNDPANVRCERTVEFGSGSELNAYWCHRWRWFRQTDGSILAEAYVTPYFQFRHSTLVVDDGTDDLLSHNNVEGMARMWEKAIDKGRV